MNLPALWVYGAGITTGIVWPYIWLVDKRWWNHLAVLAMLLALWPVFAVLMAYDYLKYNHAPWERVWQELLRLEREEDDGIEVEEQTEEDEIQRQEEAQSRAEARARERAGQSLDRDD